MGSGGLQEGLGKSVAPLAGAPARATQPPRWAPPPPVCAHGTWDLHTYMSNGKLQWRYRCPVGPPDNPCNPRYTVIEEKE
jgi:hypothetical protein